MFQVLHTDTTVNLLHIGSTWILQGHMGAKQIILNYHSEKWVLISTAIEHFKIVNKEVLEFSLEIFKI